MYFFLHREFLLQQKSYQLDFFIHLTSTSFPKNHRYIDLSCRLTNANFRWRSCVCYPALERSSGESGKHSGTAFSLRSVSLVTDILLFGDDDVLVGFFFGWGWWFFGFFGWIFWLRMMIFCFFVGVFGWGWWFFCWRWLFLDENDVLVGDYVWCFSWGNWSFPQVWGWCVTFVQLFLEGRWLFLGRVGKIMSWTFESLFFWITTVGIINICLCIHAIPMCMYIYIILIYTYTVYLYYILHIIYIYVFRAVRILRFASIQEFNDPFPRWFLPVFLSLRCRKPMKSCWNKRPSCNARHENKS